MDEPAIEVNWIAFNKEKPHDFVIPDGEDLSFSARIIERGHSEEDLFNDGWEMVKQEFVSSSPNDPSFEDTNQYLIRYKYILNPEAPGAPIKSTTREFCRDLVNKNLVYRVEDLESITNDLGSSALVWRGSYNCRHIWQQITYRKGTDIVNKGSITKGRVDGAESLDVMGLPQPDTRVPEWPSFNKQKFESYSDYPESVKNNAKAVLKYVEENGWGDCGTDVGKQRANQLANGEPISQDTIQRMYSYLSRHAVDLESSKGYDDGCGKLMYDSWGGKTALSWAESKVKQFNKEKFEVGVPHYTEDGKLYEGPTHKDADGRLMTGAVHTKDSVYLYHEDELAGEKVSIDYDDTLSTDKGKLLAKRLISEGKDLYIVTRRREEMLGPVKLVANELGISADKIHATNGKLKWETIKRLGIQTHYDNNPDELKAIKIHTPTVRGIKFDYNVGDIGGYVDPSLKKKVIPKPLVTGGTTTMVNKFQEEFEYLFTKQQEKQHFQIDSEEKRIVLGPAMIPDQKIFRKDALGNPYYVFFSSETIKMIAEKYMRNKYLDNNDQMHDGTAVKDVYVIESWIKEDMNDKSNKYGYSDLPIGTWFVSMKVKNDEIWNKVKENKLNGFSVSGFFEEVAAFHREEIFLSELAKLLKEVKE